MDIRKIRYNGTKVDIDLKRKNDQDWEDVKFSSKDQPKKLFRKALDDLKGDFRYWLEMPPEMDDKLVLHGINVSEQGSTKTFQLVGGLKLGAGFTSLNTPVLHEPTEELPTGASVLAKAARARIQSLIARAEEYYLGQRDQLELDVGEESTEEEEVAEAVH